jgi:hypothetical protein
MAADRSDEIVVMLRNSRRRVAAPAEPAAENPLKHRHLATFLAASLRRVPSGLPGVLRYIKAATDLPDGLAFRIRVKYLNQK